MAGEPAISTAPRVAARWCCSSPWWRPRRHVLALMLLLACAIGPGRVARARSSSTGTPGAPQQRQHRRHPRQSATAADFLPQATGGAVHRRPPGAAGAGSSPAAWALPTSWDEVPTFRSHYKTDDERPNACKVSYQAPAKKDNKEVNFTAADENYIPIIGTSIVRDSQLMLMRLYYSIDFPVKWLLVVVAERAYAGHSAIANELRHMRDYPLEEVGLIIMTCEHHPSVTESWNSLFHAFPDEPFGVYMARDTFWERGALAKLAPHAWRAVRTGDVDIGFATWTNMGADQAPHNIMMMTRRALNRFGLWDENIYPALCEDYDMMVRARKMKPPLKEHRYPDVKAVHGARSQRSYYPGGWLPDDPNSEEEKQLSDFTRNVRHGANCNYFMRKWGCPGETTHWMSRSHECKFTSPFNRTGVPLWYWHTSRALRARDRQVQIKSINNSVAQVYDGRTSETLFTTPQNYGEWRGYHDRAPACRVSGHLGRIDDNTCL